MRDHFGVGLAAELGAVFDEFFAQLAEILDDAVVHHRDPVGCVRMGVALGRPAVGRPAGVTDADIAAERLALEPRFQGAQLAFGAAARQHAVIERGDAGRVIAAVFEALERIDQMARDRLAPENSNDPAHPLGWPLTTSSWCSRRRAAQGNQNAFRLVTIAI